MSIVINYPELYEFISVIAVCIMLIFVIYLNIKHREYLHYFKKFDKYYRKVFSIAIMATALIYLKSGLQMFEYNTTLFYLFVDGEYLPTFNIGVFTIVAWMIMGVSFFILPGIAFYHWNNPKDSIFKMGKLMGIIALTKLAIAFQATELTSFDYLVGTPPSLATTAYELGNILNVMISIFVVFCILIPVINEAFKVEV